MPQFFFAFFSGYSAMTVFDDFYIQLYNSIFTSVPPLALAIIYWDLMTEIDGPDYEELLPKLYYTGQFRKKFNLKIFMSMMTQALFDSTVIFFICFQPVLDEFPILDPDNGYPESMWTNSITAFTALMLIVMANLFTRMKYITWLHHLSIWALSIAIYLVWMWISNWMPPQTEYAVMEAH